MAKWSGIREKRSGFYENALLGVLEGTTGNDG